MFKWSDFLECSTSRAGFQMLTSVLDPSFILSSDGYYRSLLASSSILHSLRKRICRDRERQIEVTILALSRLTIFIHQDTSATVSSTLEAYLKAPLEEFKCLRCFENVRSYSSNVNNAGSGNTMSRLPSQMTRLPRLCWRSSDVIWHRHHLQPMLKGYSHMVAWWLLTTGQASQARNWTRSFFWERMPWWPTLILAGCEQCQH